MTTVTAREVYPNAPVVLVALEVRHPATAPLSHDDRLAIKRALSPHVPVMRSEQLIQVTAALSTPAGPATPESAATPNLRTEVFPRYVSRDNTTAVSMRSDAVVVETTQYPGWEAMRSLVADALGARAGVGDVDGAERVGLRYIDEIRVPGEPVRDWAPWVDPSLLGPTAIGDKLQLPVEQWQGVSAFAAGADHTMVLRYGPNEGYAVSPAGELRRSTPAPGPYFLLDIDSFWAPSSGTPEFDTGKLLTTCDELHAPVRALFEHLITDRLRKDVLRHAG